MTRRPLSLLFALVLLAGVMEAYAQARGFTLAMRGAPLDEALQLFVEATGEAVSYESALVKGRTTSCAMRDAQAENVLRCILEDTGLDFHRLSSGTYVLTDAAEIAAERGFLAGRVIDVETGGPLSGAHVLLADAGIGAVTDQSGRFTFPALMPGSYVVSVRHLGYRAWHDSLVVHPQEQVVAEARLRADPILITPVIIDAYSEAALDDDRPQIRSSNPSVGYGASAPGTYRQLRTLSGVRLSDVTADAHIQGGDPGAHQLRLDGVPVFLPRSVAGLIGPFSSFGIDKIRVHKAGFGAAQGSQLGGILQAEHALAPVNDAEIQADPFSMNARVRLAPSFPGASSASGLVAARIGLWDVYVPPRFESMLDAWARPDEFVLLAPLKDPAAAYQLSASDELLRRPINPTLHYSDLHAAGRLQFGPLRSLSGSVYQGRQRLAGGVLSGADGFSRHDEIADFAVVDVYDWMNRTAQLGYDAVLGSRSLASVQARFGDYRLIHDYETLDSLGVVLQDDELRLSSIGASSVRDANRVSTIAFEGTLDHAVDRHHIQIGAETGLVESRFDLRSVHFSSFGEGAEPDLDPQTGFDGAVDLETRKGGIINSSDAWYAALFGEDRLRLGRRASVEAGVRLTYLHARKSIYAEPRGALRYEGEAGAIGRWSGRTSAGLYRQFLNQTDASQFSAGVLLPSVRIWLPIDGSVRPPIAYHFAQDFVARPRDRWTLRLNGYLKLQPHGLTLTYAPVFSEAVLSGRVRQRDFLAGTRSTTYGGDMSVAWKSSFLQAEVTYGYEQARRESAVLFGGRRHPVPWNEPHRLEVGLDWMPTSRLALSSRWKGIWGRSWGFRQIYYDYFGHDAGTRIHPPVDLGDPAAHVLPPLYQLDVSAAYTQPIGGVDIQLRAEVINVLDRDNVMDWRLIRVDGAWQKEARTLYPMLPSLAARVSF